MMLKNLLYDCFKKCENTPTDEFFCREFIDSIQIFFSSGVVNTADSGVIGDEPFIGEGISFSLIGDTVNSYNLLLQQVKLLYHIENNGNFILANAIGESLKLFFSNSIIKCNVDGMIQDVMIKGTSKGNMIFDKSKILSNQLNSDFEDMNYNNESIEEYNLRLGIGTKYIDSNECLCDKISYHIEDVMKNSIINTVGDNELSSIIGIGYWSII